MRREKIRWITETALLLAVLVAVQWLTKPLGQLVTGSCVNAVLALAALVAGTASGMVVALLSPVLAFLLGIAPLGLTVPAIMAGNGVFVLILGLLPGKILPWILGAAGKFATLYLLVGGLICGLAAQPLLAAGVLKEPMLKSLPTMFSWPQLITALIGGGIALLLAPVIRKGRKQNPA